MTDYTPNFGLPYLEEGQGMADTFGVLAELATKTDDALTARGVAAPGAGTVTAVAGRVTTLENMFQSMTSAQRRALSGGQLIARMFVIETDTKNLVQYTGSRWLSVSDARWFSQGIASADWQSTTFGWVTGLGAKIVIPEDGIERDWYATCAVNILGDAWWRLRVDKAASTDGSLAATTTYFPNSTGFHVVSTGEVSAMIQAGGNLPGTQKATIYLEARRNSTTVTTNVIIPTVAVTAGRPTS